MVGLFNANKINDHDNTILTSNVTHKLKLIDLLEKEINNELITIEDDEENPNCD